MELDARRMNTALHLRCRAVFMRRASRSIRCSREKPSSRYVFLMRLSFQLLKHSEAFRHILRITSESQKHVIGPSLCTLYNIYLFSAVMQRNCPLNVLRLYIIESIFTLSPVRMLSINPSFGCLYLTSRSPATYNSVPRSILNILLRCGYLSGPVSRN